MKHRGQETITRSLKAMVWSPLLVSTKDLCNVHRYTFYEKSTNKFQIFLCETHLYFDPVPIKFP